MCICFFGGKDERGQWLSADFQSLEKIKNHYSELRVYRDQQIQFFFIFCVFFFNWSKYTLVACFFIY